MPHYAIGKPHECSKQCFLSAHAHNNIVMLNVMKTCLIHADINCIVHVPNLFQGSLTDANYCIVIVSSNISVIL